MVMKKSSKLTILLFKKNFIRFLSILLIVIIGISFVTGIGTLSYKLTGSIEKMYHEDNISDINLKSTSTIGFNEDNINYLFSFSEISHIKKATIIENDNFRFIYQDLSSSINKINLIKGNYPQNEKQILANQIYNYSLYDKITFNKQEYTIVGIVSDPLYYYKSKELSLTQNEINGIFYQNINTSLISYTTDLFITLDIKSKNKDMFSNDYLDEVNRFKNKIQNNFEHDIILTLNENVSYKITKSYGEKIDVVALIFPIFFILVASLVTLTNLTRMIEDARSEIATLRSLGFSKFNIKLKYLLFSFISTLLGSIIGIILGINILPRVIYPAYNAIYYMPSMTNKFELMHGYVSSIFTILTALLITLFETNKSLKETPASLMNKKAPKIGKKILLERLPFIYNKLPFSYKSSLRNIFRYKAHLFMTVISIMGSTILVIAGLGLYNIAKSKNTVKIPISMLDSFAFISLVIIIFAAILCILVIFSLTNMNIQERVREIATLRVLGYQNNQCGRYIYREVLIMSIIGIIIGIPLGYLLLKFIFYYLDFGNIHDVKFISYIITFVFILICIFLVDLLLYKKIRKIDMNSSLKSNE